MTDTEDGLFEFDRTREALERLAVTARDNSREFPSPEAGIWRDVTSHAYLHFGSREGEYAGEDEYALREIQALIDIRRAADMLLTRVVGEPETLREATWRRIGAVLGMSRQAAHERYSGKAVGKTRR